MACLARYALRPLPYMLPAAAPCTHRAGQLEGVRLSRCWCRCFSGFKNPNIPNLRLTACAAQVLVEKARVEAEEAQRILLAALNGLAGLMILDSDRPQAVALYRKVRAGCEHAVQQHCAHVHSHIREPQR